MSSIAERLRPVIEPIVESEGASLVDMEYVKEGPDWFFRVYADTPEGITLDDCAQISEKVSDKLDSLQPDPFPEAYYLEVSSPGAERPLRSEADIEGAVGKYVYFSYYAHQHGQKDHYGTLVKVTDDHYVLEIRNKTRTSQIEIDKNAIAQARLAIEF